MATLVTTRGTITNCDAGPIYSTTNHKEDDFKQLESDVRSFEQCLINVLMDPLDQQNLAALYLSSMKLLPYINNPVSADKHAQSPHRKYLIDRVFLLLLALHHPDCSLGKSKQKFKQPSSKSMSSGRSQSVLPRDWLLDILTQTIHQK
ncbi:hypothetical protein MJO29_004461 [Puccinia striiformis f. sp. tritici]|uniref:Uncharacterized protein n=1 Tax=Puccinia striiformis f. sp. tritici PST-78 TaxID=1165861 RepID=A0A0L0UU64_9BASI|nr:hypothetical protein Pst134EA_007525 [Puccinia striiformis f. sp. tritici]KAH9470261.1 hypothetical protein Pst134EA_007525 [Puccinia striiformis f. sp. tritici]KAI7964034.1 hypothetical protein MJO29_004461 [Puccinia striiformis f. sp. tritici]KNE90592.1 hypothetical protein PSTG_15965 [Puccinia striiformis f. sp. tritici PST-78]